jgi:hypothetical protein
VEREVLVGAGKTGYEVILEGVDGSFGGVLVVDMWWDKLEVDIFVGHVFFEWGRAFVV